VNRWPVALLALAFPLLSHAAALSGSQALALAAVAALILAVAWPLRRHFAFLLILAAAGLVLAAAWRAGRVQTLALLPPMLITFAVGWQFARTLQAGRVPLIERVVSVVHPEALALPGVPAYARRVTLLWALLLGGLGLGNTLLALLAVPDGLLEAAGVAPFAPVPLRHWSVFANLVNYLAIAGFFAAEFLYRRTRFPQQPYRGFGDFVGRLARLGPAFWRGR
jgi:uncharacterized membrane protein